MIVVIDGKVYNSEDVTISVLIYSNERGELASALAQGHDIFNCFPKDTKESVVKKNADEARRVQQKLLEVRGGTDPSNGLKLN
jgi:hypothetical protein